LFKAIIAWNELQSLRSVWECGGRAQRRHRFRADKAYWKFHLGRARESGVALHFPPQSKTRSRES
jgi:hypothetical protein